MAELWRPSEHEPLAGEEWDEGHVEAAIATIVADAEAAFDGSRWPWHPRDGEDDGSSNVYLGGAGVIWALHELGSTDWDDAALAFLEGCRVQPPFRGASLQTSYSFGELGAALVAFRLTGDVGVADRIHDLVVAVHATETNEMMAGTPGSLLVAEAMLAWTGEPSWDEAWRSSAVGVLAARDDDGLWTQHFFGPSARYLGPAHGYAGNMRALANRGDPPPSADLSPYLLREGELANWQPREGSRPDEIRVQWCHGAAGMVTTLGDLLDLDLALAGGELTWRAGPLAKGPNLCHGTAGNAYAFLVLHKRTADELWLERARAFAMHAIGQVERERAAVGRGRYSLFTGDVGVALFLRHLLYGEDRFPTMGPFARPADVGLHLGDNLADVGADEDGGRLRHSP